MGVQLLQRIDALPALPASVAELAALLGDAQSGAADFEAVIALDPVMTANLLRYANSARNASRVRMTTVAQAAARVGTKRLLDVCVGAAFHGILPEVLPGYRVDRSALWIHSIAVGVISEQLANELSFEAPRLTFTAGLLHDIGKLAVGTFLAETGADIEQHLFGGAELSLQDTERELLGTEHAEVGCAIARRWRLGKTVEAVTRWHHAPTMAPDDDDRRLVGLVHIADGLAHCLGYGADVGELSRRIEPEVVETLGITETMIERVACDSADEIAERCEHITE